MKTPRKYKPWTAKAQTWDSIEKRYIEDWSGKHLQLLELVRQIKNSSLKDRLFGSTSMDKLVISIYDPLDYQKEALHVIFNLEKNQWHFEYVEKPFEKTKFIRTYNHELGIEKLENFIKMVKW